MRSVMFKIRAYSKTLGVDFYKEILNNDNLSGILTNIERYPQTIRSFYQMLEEKEKERYDILLEKATIREEQDRKEHKQKFVESHQHLSIQELNEKLLAAAIDFSYDGTNSTTLENTLKELYMDIEAFGSFLKNQSEDTKEPKIIILYELMKTYEIENDQTSSVYLVKNFIKRFLQTIKDINLEGYEVMFKSRPLFQKEDLVNAYDMLEHYLEFTPKENLGSTLSRIARELMENRNSSTQLKDLVIEL